MILWPDTWNNHFHPTTAQAAVEVLEDAGFQVTIPAVQLCCGRPLYDYGMLDLAKTMLQEVLEALRPQIREGVCVVGLEPSCVSVFRDEMTNLLGPDRRREAPEGADVSADGVSGEEGAGVRSAAHCIAKRSCSSIAIRKSILDAVGR